MARLMLHRQILRNFHGLPTNVQKRVSELVGRFQTNPQDPAIGLHGLKESTLDPKVRGAKLPAGYRAIIVAPEKGDTYLLVHIDKHDAAYAWARNKRFEVHEVTGVFQVFDAEEIAIAAREARPAEPDRPGYVLAQLSEDELFRAGVPRPLVPAVREIRSDEGLDALAEYLPPDSRDVLYGIAAGMTLEESLEQMLGVPTETAVAMAPESPGDFSQIERVTNFDLVPVEGEEHLKEILERSLEEWRIFLHPYQLKLVQWNTKGPMNLTGSAGTGKTVALMHRAVHLARKREDGSSRLLLTTFTTNLSVTIKHHLQRLAPDVAEGIEVTNLHALARTICFRSGWKGRVAEHADIADIWEEVWKTPDLGELPMTREVLQAEYELIVDPNGIDSEEGYLTTVRSGRPRISRRQRREAWPVLRTFQRGLKKRNLLTFEGAIHQARLAAEQESFTRYAHVLVDEVQDFSLEALRLIRAISPIDAGTPDPLCTVGDGHQRIYRAKVPLSRAGINIRGRSRRLKINYRTSQQIRRWAQGILEGVEIDDLDGGETTTVGDHSVFQGPEPLIERCRDEKEEARAILKWVQSLLEGEPPAFATHEICVTPYKPAIRAALNDAVIATYELRPREEDPGEDIAGVRLGTMKRIKGLEFRAVAMACASPVDAMNHVTEAPLLDRCERYVAATRARERLLITLAAGETKKRA